MKRTTIMLPPQLKAQAQREARRNGESLGEFIRASMQAKLGQADRAPRQRFFADAFVFEDNGPADLSANVDKYLAEMREKDYQRVQSYAHKNKTRKTQRRKPQPLKRGSRL